MNVNDPMSSSSGYASEDYASNSDYGTSDYMSEVDDYVRRNPGGAILVALGVGLLLGAALRSLQPQKPENRLAAMLGDIQDRLQDLTKPVYRGAARAADAGGDLVQEGVDRLNDLHLDRRLKGWGRRLRSFLP